MFKDNNLHYITTGVLLGDASLQTFTNGKTWRLRFIQKNKEYIDHLYDLYKDYVKTGPRENLDQNGNSRWYFNTVVCPELNYYADLFYKKNLKVIPSNLGDIFNDLSLTYWYLDDGSLKSNAKAYIICTDCFSLDELKIIESLFIEKYKIYISFHKQRKNQYRVYIPVKYYEVMREIMELRIQKLVPSMLYKI